MKYLAGLAAMGSVACGQPAPGPSAPPRAEFQSPQRVEILGYRGSTMEPYIACDGRYLFFNNRNEPGEQTDVLFAEKAENDPASTSLPRSWMRFRA